LRGRGVRVDLLRQCAQEADVHESERDQGVQALPRKLSRVPGKRENLNCIQLDLSPFCKIDAHLPLRRLPVTLVGTLFVRIRSTGAVRRHPGVIRGSRRGVPSLVLQMQTNKRRDGK
jgi:hypothetical protein